MPKFVALEHEEQAAFFEGVAWSYKNRADFSGLLLFATFNGEIWRSASRLRNEGLVRGVSDILYLQPRGGFSYFACELKRMDRKDEKNGGLTEAEAAWLKSAKQAGAFVCVAYGADEAKQLFENYMSFAYSDLVTRNLQEGN